jgi:hypothetical protein
MCYAGTNATTAPVVQIQIHDIDFEPGTEDDKDKTEVGFYVHRNFKMIDTCTIEDNHTMKVSLRNVKPAMECVRIIVQNVHDEEFFGSISLNVGQYILAASTAKNVPYKQWITLFDCTEDDEFDGVLGEDDEEFPKIQCTITVIEDDVLDKSQDDISQKSPLIVQTEDSLDKSYKSAKTIDFKITSSSYVETKDAGANFATSNYLTQKTSSQTIQLGSNTAKFEDDLTVSTDQVQHKRATGGLAAKYHVQSKHHELPDEVLPLANPEVKPI